MRTVCMVMLKAVRDVLGNEAEVVIENSIDVYKRQDNKYTASNSVSAIACI